MRCGIGTIVAFCWLLTLGGCAGHQIKYDPFIKNRFQPADHAIAVTGSFDEAKAIFEKAQLPHLTARGKLELVFEGLDTLTQQLGSPDYVLIGEVYGGGNAWATHESLTNAFCKKAARKGGDVVLVFRRGTIQQPYHYTVPGYSTTTANATVYDYGNYATGYGNSYTTYTPSQTYSGVFYKPTANGLVFKHVPGVDAARKSLLELGDESLTRVLNRANQLSNDPQLSWEETQEQIKRFRAAVEAEDTGTDQ